MVTKAYKTTVLVGKILTRRDKRNKNLLIVNSYKLR